MSMAAAALTTPVNRRLFLAAGPAAGVFAALGAAALAELPLSPDAELLALGHQLETAWAAERAAESAESCGDAAYSAYEDAAQVTSHVARKIVTFAATTLAGLKVKARAVQYCYCGQDLACLDEDSAPENTADMLGVSIARDLLNI